MDTFKKGDKVLDIFGNVYVITARGEVYTSIQRVGHYYGSHKAYTRYFHERYIPYSEETALKLQAINNKATDIRRKHDVLAQQETFPLRGEARNVFNSKLVTINQ